MDPRPWHDPGGRPADPRVGLGDIHLEMLGWREIEHRVQTGLWQDVDGDFLGLVRVQGNLGLPPLRDEDAVRRHGGAMAQEMASRLIEAAVLDHVEGRAVMFVCRRLEAWTPVFTGVLMIPTPRASWVWSMVARGWAVTRDLSYLCEDCTCPAHPLWRVRHSLRQLLTVRLSA